MRLLPPELQKRFADERFGPSDKTRDAYVLARNTFVILDPDLKVALDVVRKMRKASRGRSPHLSSQSRDLPSQRRLAVMMLI